MTNRLKEKLIELIYRNHAVDRNFVCNIINEIEPLIDDALEKAHTRGMNLQFKEIEGWNPHWKPQKTKKKLDKQK